jgi:hypothetical protein
MSGTKCKNKKTQKYNMNGLKFASVAKTNYKVMIQRPTKYCDKSTVLDIILKPHSNSQRC